MSTSPNSSLTEPFLQKDTTSTPSSPSNMTSLKLSSLLLGSAVAVLSQIALAATLSIQDWTWPYQHTLVLSCVWSIVTCCLVFGAMKLWTTMTSSSTQSLTTAFQVEGHWVSGALLAVAFYWIASDVLVKSSVSSSSSLSFANYGVILGSMIAAVYGSVVILIVGSPCTTDDSNKATTTSNHMMSTYHVLASVLGWIVGLCSQFVLSVAFVWVQHYYATASDNEEGRSSNYKDMVKQPNGGVLEIVLFSMLWSVCTVVLTYAGCWALRCLVVDEEELGETAPSTMMLPGYWKAKVQLRMESCYILAALLGICAAWILMDVVLELQDQIVPSLTLLALAVAAFGAIVRCFPEEECLQEYYSTDCVDYSGLNEKEWNLRSTDCVDHSEALSGLIRFLNEKEVDHANSKDDEDLTALFLTVQIV